MIPSRGLYFVRICLQQDYVTDLTTLEFQSVFLFVPRSLTRMYLCHYTYSKSTSYVSICILVALKHIVAYHLFARHCIYYITCISCK